MAVRANYATLISGGSRVALPLRTDQAGALEFYMQDRTSEEQGELVWEMGDFRGGTGQAETTEPQNIYLFRGGINRPTEVGNTDAFWYSRNLEVTRQGTLVAGRSTTGGTQAGVLQRTTPWTAKSGTYRVSSSGAIHYAGISSDAVCIATLNTAANTTTLEARVRVSNASFEAGIVFRYAGSQDYWRAVINSSTQAVELTKLVANVKTVVGTSSQTIATGTFYRLRVTQTAGNAFAVFFNGTSVITATDSAIAANNQHGLFAAYIGAHIFALDDGIFDWFLADGFLYDDFMDVDNTALGSHTPGLGSVVRRYVQNGTSLLVVTRLNVFIYNVANTRFDHVLFADTSTSQGNTFRDGFSFGANVFATVSGNVNYWYAASPFTSWTQGSSNFYAQHMTRLRDIVVGLGNDRTLRTTADPTNSGTWTNQTPGGGSQGAIGDADTKISVESLVTWGDLAVAGTSEGIYTIDYNGEVFSLTPEVKQINAAGNTRWMTVWQGKLVVPLYKGRLMIYASPGGDPVDISPLTLNPTMPEFTQGTVEINGLAGDAQWLYAHLYCSNAGSVYNRSTHILQGRFEGRSFVWYNVAYFDLTVNGATTINDSSGLDVNNAVGTDTRLWWGDDETGTRDVNARYVILTTWTTNYQVNTTAGSSYYRLYTSHFVGRRHAEIMRFEKVRVAAYNLSAGAREWRVYYAVDARGQAIDAITWTQMVDSSGAAAVVNTNGVTELYFSGANAYGRSVILAFEAYNSATTATPILEGFTLWSRSRNIALNRFRILTTLTAENVTALQRLGAPIPRTVVSNTSTVRNTQANRVQLQAPDGVTYDVDVVSVSVTGLRPRKARAMGYDYTAEVIADEVKVA